MTASALYTGSVMHERLRPRRHRLRYRVFWLLLDLDELDLVDRGLKLFSRNGWNLISFRDTDYGPWPGAETLKAQIEGQLRGAGVEPDGGPIAILTMPRVFGYAFNPLSVYFCRRRDGSLAAIVYEVNNTFGERHSYVARVEGRNDGGSPIRQHVDKAFYVSPFLDMELAYEFRVVPPAERVALSILASDRDGVVLSAALEGFRKPLTDGAILRASLAFPLVTLAVIAGIHWEALRIWLKGVRLRRRPPPPATPATVVSLHAKDA